ncbi:unnamed protein product [Durusdinium trenchii]|uniref:Thioredoxin domain-containing protein n=1 Tax=Durusdinium trenchii TaxID=1381693 RepID=A0ABP0HE25_9DINO
MSRMSSDKISRPWRRLLKLFTIAALGALRGWVFAAPGPRFTSHLTRHAGTGGLEDIQKMRAREIKKELEDAGVDISDIFDKDDLVERLHQLRSGVIHGTSTSTSADSSDRCDRSGVASEHDGAGADTTEGASSEARSAPGPQSHSSDTSEPSDLMAKCKAMRVKELRTELGQRGISWADALDKDELVERLAGVLQKEALFCSSGRLKPGMVTKITGAELEEELRDSTTPLLLDVYAVWCGPCKMMEPQLANAAKALGNRVRVAKMDSDEETNASSKLRVEGLPTLILFDRKGNVAQRVEGALMEQQIIDLVNSANL